MTLIIQKPTGAKLNLAQTYVGIDDPDAAVYVAAVEAADGQSLETATRVAIHSFVKGCKADGIWHAIKASCILAGARTLTGALVPLVGTAPTNVSFVSGDYNRETGLKGDKATKYLNSNRTVVSDNGNNSHLSVYITEVTSSGSLVLYYAGHPGAVTARGIGKAASSNQHVSVSFTGGLSNVGPSTGVAGLFGQARASGASYVARTNATSETITSAASAETDTLVTTTIFSRSADRYTDARLAFYSIGESLDLALLDTRVTTLINAFGAAIP